MYPDLHLNEKWRQYRCGELDKRALTGLLYQSIVREPDSYRLLSFSPEERDDFAAWLYPRICSAIERYEERGVGFEGYFYSMVLMSRREYRQRNREHQDTERTVWFHRTIDRVSEQEYDYGAEARPIALSETGVRQILVLSLKCAMELPVALTCRIAQSLRIPSAHMNHMVHFLKGRMQQQEERYQIQLRRIEGQYYRMLSLETRFRNAAEGSSRRAELEGMRDRSRAMLDSMRRKLPRIRRRVPNREIASLLGIPKGTVDSLMHHLKKKGIKTIPPGGEIC